MEFAIERHFAADIGPEQDQFWHRRVAKESAKINKATSRILRGVQEVRCGLNELVRIGERVGVDYPFCREANERAIKRAIEDYEAKGEPERGAELRRQQAEFPVHPALFDVSPEVSDIPTAIEVQKTLDALSCARENPLSGIVRAALTVLGALESCDLLRKFLMVPAECLPPGDRQLKGYTYRSSGYPFPPGWVRLVSTRAGGAPRNTRLDAIVLLALAEERAGGEKATPAGLAEKVLNRWMEHRDHVKRETGIDIGDYRLKGKDGAGGEDVRESLKTRFRERLNEWARPHWKAKKSPRKKR